MVKAKIQNKVSRRSGLLLPIEPFSSAMWTAELIAFVAVAIAITIIKKTIHNVQIDFRLYWLETVAIFMLQSITITSMRISEIIFCTVALLVCLLIANAYSAGLASVMTVLKFDPPIDSTHDIIINMEWGTTQDAWVFDLLDATEVTD